MGKYMRKCKGNGEIAVMEVAQIGVRTRARTLALAMATGKRKNSGRISPEEFQATDLQLRSSRRNLSNENPTISPSKSTNSERITPAEFQVSNLQLRSSRRNLSHENKTISPAISSNSGGISPAEFQVSNLQLRSSRRNVSHENMKISPAKSANSGRIQADLWINHDRFPISRCSSNGSTELVVERLRSGDREVKLKARVLKTQRISTAEKGERQLLRVISTQNRTIWIQRRGRIPALNRRLRKCHRRLRSKNFSPQLRKTSKSYLQKSIITMWRRICR
ncbi:uncharacterized protein LOC143857812 isoform X1 [Tasmannia lanceolata]|uniref:uncharacterized protein LOC143857812 isoform X1 n=1 Tax=Tasmannia lanceolata TaxID=3420 RepID=UPI004062B485